MTTAINNELDTTSLPKGCSCSECSQITNGALDNDTFNDDVFAPSVTATPEQFANYLTDGFWSDRGSIARQWDTSSDNIITFSVSNEFSAAQKDGFRMAFDTWADVTNLTFQEVSSGADMTINEGDDGQAYSSSSVYSNGNIASNVISIDTAAWYWQNFNELGDYAMITAIHEIGHSLGLGHTGNYNGSATYSNDAQFINDSRQYSVMSYFDASNTGSNHQGEYASTPLIYDILAIQNKYGANMNARAGNTIYGFNTTETGSEFDFTVNVKPVVAVWDGAGTDTIDVSGWSGTQMINLNDGEFSNIGGGTGNFAIAFNAVIENAVGGSGNDTIYGNEVANVLTGNAGDDTFYGSLGSDAIYGGDGTDTLIYNYDLSDLNVSFIDSTNLIIAHNGSGFTDDVIDVENFTFNGTTYTISELQSAVAFDAVELKFAGTDNDGAFSFKKYIDGAGQTFFGHDLGYTGDSTEYLTYSREGNSTLHVRNSFSSPVSNTVSVRTGVLSTLTVNNFETSIVDLSNTADINLEIRGAQTGRANTSSGNDTIEIISNNGYNNTLGADFVVNSGAGNDAIMVANLYDNLSTTIYAGDGNDSVSGEAFNGRLKIYGEGGDDTVTALQYDLEFIGGAGNDTIIYTNGINAFTFNSIDSETLHITQGNSLSHVVSAENFEFNGVSYSFNDLYSYANMDLVQVKFAGSNNDGAFSNKYFSTQGGYEQISGSAFGITGTDRLFGIDRTSTTELSVTNTSYNVDNHAYDVDFASISDNELRTLTMDSFEAVSTYMLNSAGTSTTLTNTQSGRVYTGAGNDTINITASLIDAGNSVKYLVNAATGDDVINYNGGNSTLTAEINGNDGNDTITITGSASTVIYAGNGIDNITGGDGGDVVYGIAGTNTINTGASNDYVSGGTGVDNINGGSGNDNLYGWDGDDVIYGGANDDTLNGNAGADTLYGDDGFDVIKGGSGNDRLEGGNGIDILYGEADNDLLFGGGVEADRLYGGAGDDTLVGDGSRDLLYGQSGADVFSVADGGFTYDRFADFDLTEGDAINLTDILTGYTHGVDDLNDFVLVEDRGSHHRLYVDQDGTGSSDSWSVVAQIFDGGTLTGQTVDTLLANNDLIVDSNIV